MVLDHYIWSDKGGQENNEDSAGGKSFLNGAVFVVADGLGGHQGGALASGCVVNVFLEAEEPEGDVGKWLTEQLLRANTHILQKQEEEGTSIKSTAASLLIYAGRAYWAHVGDSRVYYLHRGNMESVTEDHSVAYKKYLAGMIPRNAIAQDPDQSALLFCLGSKDRATPETGEAKDPLEEGDGFLLCTDGFWEYVQDEEILIDFLKAEDAKKWAELLLLRVMEKMPEDADNLSLITAMIL